jgi:hypothetical protein
MTHDEEDEKLLEDLKRSIELLRQKFLNDLRELLSKTPHPDARRVAETYIKGIEENPWV